MKLGHINKDHIIKALDVQCDSQRDKPFGFKATFKVKWIVIALRLLIF